MYKDWLSADSSIEPLVGTVLSTGEPEPEYIESSFFCTFDYVPSVNTRLLSLTHSSDTFSLYKEGDAEFEVKYVDTFLAQSAGYPKLILFSSGVFVSSNPLYYNSASDSYKTVLALPQGEYEYQYITTNEEYFSVLGEYSVGGRWYSTSLPYDFSRIRPLDYSKELPSNVPFGWNISSDEGDLHYEFYIGLSPSKNNLEKHPIGPSANAVDFLISSGLNHTKQYYWYMTITNKHGASIETDLFTFYTGGTVEKFYNAPNPFNPAKGQQTQFVFNMPEDGTAQLSVYSEYGDKVYESQSVWFQADGNSKSMFYDGKDNSGRMLYNGSYLAVLTKKYSGKTKTERHRILIIK